jgi:3-hydroxyacyl-CoA dehydrogenase
VVASSAPEARQKGYLRDQDYWVMHNNEVLFAALAEIKALQAANYQPPLKTCFKVAGRQGYARLQIGLVNLQKVAKFHNMIIFLLINWHQ